MQTLQETEAYLAKQHNRKFCKITGSGTTALYLLLKTRNIANQRVALPNNVCLNVLLPIYFAGAKPVFVDSDKETLGVDIDQVPSDIDTLIAVHAYGNIYDLEKTHAFCTAHTVLYIEDVAIAQGITHNDQIVGSFGEVAVLSFGSGKILDIGHGGAILTDNELIYQQICEELEKLPQFSEANREQITQIGRQHTKLYNIDYGQSLNDHYEAFKSLCMAHQSDYLYQFDEQYLEPLQQALAELDQRLAWRQQNAHYLQKKFTHANLPSIKILEPKYGSAYWRFNIFVETHRDELFKYLLSKKYKVSSWQHSVDKLFEPETVTTPMSAWIEDRIINLWVNEDIDPSYLDAISDDIIRFLQQKA